MRGLSRATRGADGEAAVNTSCCEPRAAVNTLGEMGCALNEEGRGGA